MVLDTLWLTLEVSSQGLGGWIGLMEILQERARSMTTAENSLKDSQILTPSLRPGSNFGSSAGDCSLMSQCRHIPVF